MNVLTAEEWVKTAKLMAITTMNTCDESIAIIDEAVDTFIKVFAKDPPTEQQKSRLVALNQAHGEAAVELVKVKVLVAKCFEDEEIWLAGNRQQQRRTTRMVLKMKRKVRAVADRIMSAHAECKALKESIKAESDTENGHN